MEYIAASNDRVAIHQALKHLIVGGNALIYMHKDGLKTFPLTRYVVERDGETLARAHDERRARRAAVVRAPGEREVVGHDAARRDLERGVAAEDGRLLQRRGEDQREEHRVSLW